MFSLKPSTAQETGASAVFFNHLYDPISLVRDNEVKVSLASLGVTARSFNGDLWYEPWEMLNDAGEPFVEFEAFWANIVKMEYPVRASYFLTLITHTFSIRLYGIMHKFLCVVNLL